MHSPGMICTCTCVNKIICKETYVVQCMKIKAINGITTYWTSIIIKVSSNLQTFVDLVVGFNLTFKLVLMHKNLMYNNCTVISCLSTFQQCVFIWIKPVSMVSDNKGHNYCECLKSDLHITSWFLTFRHKTSLFSRKSSGCC